MADVTKIEWCHHTFNPWIGCTKVSPGCKHCYAEADQANRRGRVVWGANGTRSRTSEANWKKPLKWNREAEARRERRRVFCASLADVFEDWSGPIVDHHGVHLVHGTRGPIPEDNEQAESCSRFTMDDMRADLFRLIDQTPWLDWMLLTKRTENIGRMWPDYNCDECGGFGVVSGWSGSLSNNSLEQTADDCPKCSRLDMRHRLNVWLGCSVSDQDTAEQQIPHLLKCRDLSPCLFVSYEPATGPVQFRNLAWGPHGGAVSWLQNGTPAKLELVIVGGESGPNARPCNIEWIRDTVQQCEHAGVACFVKQVGSNAWDYDDGGITGNEADVPYRVTDPKGGNPDEWPEYIQVRQIPETTQGSSR